MSTRHQQVRRDKAQPIAAAELRHHVVRSDVPNWLKDELCRMIRRHEEPRGGWPFVFVSAERNQEVIDFCLSTDRPKPAVRLWALLLRSISTDTGEVLLSRDEIAERLGISVENVSRLMTALERFGAIRRDRMKLAGLKGHGPARYFVNPDVAWRGPLTEREQKAREVPTTLHLELIPGGKE